MDHAGKPLNVWSRSEEEIGRLMSNFSHTPFTLDGVEYASVEAFYGCLLLAAPRRERVRKLYGIRAKHEIPTARPRSFEYCGEAIGLGSAEHIALLNRALRAKLEAHPDIAAGFIATRPRPIAHETGYEDRPDAEFPKAVFCRVLTELREEFAAASATSA